MCRCHSLGKTITYSIRSAYGDIAGYSFKNGNDDWQWRAIRISAREVLEKGEPKVGMTEEFMRAECRKLFHDT